jgi:putative transposase
VAPFLTWRHHRRDGSVGHVWQGRFKSPVIQDDGYLLVVLRYIGSNPLRAGMVADLADYRWSSFMAHGLGRPDPSLSPFPELDDLGHTPAGRQVRWRRKVNVPQGGAELKRVRESVRRGKPLGAPEWVDGIARRLGLNLNPRRPGRPPKRET